MGASSLQERENGGWTTPRSWRRHLLGSLQGQLQLATYLAVFIGFTGASGVGLWIGQRNLIQNDERELRRSADSIQMCLVKGEGNPEVVQQELLLHSSMRTSLWLEKTDGVLVLPESDHLAISDRAIRASMELNPERVVGLQKLVDVEDVAAAQQQENSNASL